MTAFVAHPDSGERWEHLLLELRDPSVRVALVSSRRIEPARLAYYLELAGVGPWDRLAVFDPTDDAGLRRFIGTDLAVVPRIDARLAWGESGVATVFVTIHPGGRVQVVAACDSEPFRHPASGDVRPLFRAAAGEGARLARAGAVGRFAVAVDAGGEVVGADPDACDHGYATMLALRANALRVGLVHSSWRDVVDALRASGTGWNPLSRAGVVAFAAAGGVELVALGNTRSEAEERFASACAALPELALAA